jgi:hypothetical protein
MRQLIILSLFLANACVSGQALFSGLLSSTNDRGEWIKNAVVRISCPGKEGESELVSGGLIVGYTEKELFVVTSNHGVRGPERPTCGAPMVELYWRKGSPVKAVLSRQFDRDYDLAVVAVPCIQHICENVWMLYVGPPSKPASLKRGDEIFPLGFPLGRRWSKAVIASKVDEVENDRIFSHGLSVAPGQSGGPLLSSEDAIIGIVTNQSETYSAAVSIEKVLDLARRWRVSTSLFDQQLNPGEYQQRRSTSSQGLHLPARLVEGEELKSVAGVSSPSQAHVYCRCINTDRTVSFSEELFAVLANKGFTVRRGYPVWRGELVQWPSFFTYDTLYFFDRRNEVKAREVVMTMSCCADLRVEYVDPNTLGRPLAGFLASSGFDIVGPFLVGRRSGSGPGPSVLLR